MAVSETKRSPGKPAGVLWRVLRSAALVYMGLWMLMASCQRRYIYYPQRATEAELNERARILRMRRWPDAGGETIGWRAGDGRRPDAAVLVFHGNAGFALHRDYISSALLTAGPGQIREVALFEYPGYGARPGHPSQPAFLEAAEEAFMQLREELPDARIFLVGESIGAGVACALAGAHPDAVAGLLLITPFTSLTDVGRHHYPYLPVGRFLRDRYDNVTALKGYAGPVGIVVADADTVVPAKLGRKLHQSYTGPKMLRNDAGRTHNELSYSPHLPWWSEIWRFLDHEIAKD
ncbi:MAG: alpha/beta fold hydrolase [Kiritimatiellia bacterium]|nr:alpha/beta fold hydrolase [Kiritimatiellia bacterium]